MFTIWFKNGEKIDVDKKTTRSGATINAIIKAREEGNFFRLLGSNGHFMFDPNEVTCVMYKED